MTTGSLQGGGPEPTARAAVVSVGASARSRLAFQSQTSRRLAFGYLLLAPAALYVLLLVGAPFVFSLYLAVSDANVGDPVATFIGAENFRAALEMDVFWTALRNSVVFLVVAAIFKSILGTSLAFLLLQEFPGKKLIRGLVVIPFTLPIAISAEKKPASTSPFNPAGTKLRHLMYALSGSAALGKIKMHASPVRIHGQGRSA